MDDGRKEDLGEAGKAVLKQSQADAEQAADDLISDKIQFFSFRVGEDIYAVDIMSVREITGWTVPTRVPNSLHYLRGVLNLRGSIIPIYDLQARFSSTHTDANESHVIVFMIVDERIIGVLVDAVSDILNVSPDEIRQSPKSNNEIEVDQAYVEGLVSVNQKMVVILNVNELFASSLTDVVEDAA